MHTRKLWKRGRFVLFIGLVIAIGLVSLSCVKGLAPIGWSGGAVANGKIYVGARDSTLTAVNLSDLSRQKSEVLKAKAQSGLFGCNAAYGGGCATAAGVAIYGTPAFSDNLVYIAGYNGKVYAYNADNLAARWVYPRDGFIDPIVGAVVTDGTRLYFGTSAGLVYALDATTGDLDWSYQTGDKIWGSATVVDGTVYIGSFDKNLYAFNAADGTVRWTFKADGSFIAAPLVQDGVVYVGAFDRTLYAIDAATGRQKWSFRGGNWFWSQPAIVGGTLYAPCLDGKVYALDPGDGSLVKSYDTQDNIPSGIAVDGTSIFVAGEAGTIHKIDTVTGQMTTLATLDKITIDGPVLIYDGTLYIQNSSYQLVGINETTGAVTTISLAS